MSRFITLGANGKTPKFGFFVIRVHYEKLGHMLKPLMTKFRSDISVHLKDIAEKQGPAKLKPIGGFLNARSPLTPSWLSRLTDAILTTHLSRGTWWSLVVAPSG